MADIRFGGGWNNSTLDRMSDSIRSQVLKADAVYEQDAARGERERQARAEEWQARSIQLSVEMAQERGEPVNMREALSNGVGRTRADFLAWQEREEMLTDMRERQALKRMGIRPEDIEVQPLSDAGSPNAKLYGELGSDLGKRMSAEDRDRVRAATGWDPVTRTSDDRSRLAAENVSERIAAAQASGDAAIRRRALNSDSRIRAIASEEAARVGAQAKKDSGAVIKFAARLFGGQS